MYNITQGSVCETIVTAKKRLSSECVCRLSYPACKAHAPYYIVNCGLSGCTTFFSNYVIDGKIFGKITEHKKCVLIFSANFF